MKLKDFKILKTNLLKTWNTKKYKTISEQKNFELLTNGVRRDLLTNLKNTLIYEKGATPENGAYIWNDGELERVFGLPYTDCGEFAALFNTNTQARAKYCNIYFYAVALDENFDAVIIFEDEKENYYYFYNFDFLQYQTELKKKEHARKAAEHRTNTNKAIKKAIEILAKHNGETLGEKTREKITAELNEAIKEYKITCYLKIDKKTFENGYYTSIVIYSEVNRAFSDYFYIDFLDNNKKINIKAEEAENNTNKLKEFEAIKTYNRKQVLKKKLQKQAHELLESVREYNKINDLLYLEDRATVSATEINLLKIENGDVEGV